MAVDRVTDPWINPGSRLDDVEKAASLSWLTDLANEILPAFTSKLHYDGLCDRVDLMLTAPSGKRVGMPCFELSHPRAPSEIRAKLEKFKETVQA